MRQFWIFTWFPCWPYCFLCSLSITIQPHFLSTIITFIIPKASPIFHYFFSSSLRSYSPALHSFALEFLIDWWVLPRCSWFSSFFRQPSLLTSSPLQWSQSFSLSFILFIRGKIASSLVATVLFMFFQHFYLSIAKWVSYSLHECYIVSPLRWRYFI